MTDHTFTVDSESGFGTADLSGLNNVITDIDIGAASGPGNSYTIDFGDDLALATDLLAINIAVDDTLTILGNGHTLDGGGTQRGFFVYAGNVTIDQLTIADAVATGGAGGRGYFGGGGGAGLGGGLFIASSGTATLNDVRFAANRAVGGRGGDSIASVNQGVDGGGGGLGGAGSDGSNQDGGGGGGGIGSGAAGGTTLDVHGGAGIVPGATGSSFQGAGGGGGAGGRFIGGIWKYGQTTSDLGGGGGGDGSGGFGGGGGGGGTQAGFGGGGGGYGRGGFGGGTGLPVPFSGSGRRLAGGGGLGAGGAVFVQQDCDIVETGNESWRFKNRA